MRPQTKTVRRRVIFPRTTKRVSPSVPVSTSASSCGSKAKPRTTARLSRAPRAGQELDHRHGAPSAGHQRPEKLAMTPELFTARPPVKDALRTSTSVAQDETAEMCIAYLSANNADLEHNEHGLPRLDRERHTRFLHNTVGRLPAPFVAADASRPWFLYWSLNALSLLGVDVREPYAARVADTARSMQNDSGGFGGGHGQTSHLATTYAVVLAVTLAGDEDALAVIDRRSTWKWLCSLKQADGGFRMSVGGEEDVRGAYCAAVIITLLKLPLELSRDSEVFGRDPNANLFTGLGDYVRRCQTFEGGISGQPDAEAHGAYAFCALGCLSLLGTPNETIPKYLNLPRLISWLSSRQYAPEGGFSGRTNKLVDGCYSHWVGGCWPLIEACLQGPVPAPSLSDNAPEPMFSREGIIRYILCCCQDQTRRGGLRDKPGKSSDAYHSCYVLSGLSSAENRWQLIGPERSEDGLMWEGPHWEVSPYQDEVQIFEEEDRVRPVHPIYVIPKDKVDFAQAYFELQAGF